MSDQLDAIDPESALELYLDDRRNEVSKHTIYAHKCRMGHFLRWCDENNIDELSMLTRRQLHEFRIWRRNDGDLSPASEKTQMDTLRVFIRWCENIGFVEPDLHMAVQSPTLAPGDNVRDVMLPADTAADIEAHLERYEYASLAHVLFLLLWRTGMRIGAAHSLDVEDYNSNEQYLEVIHRPETDTPIKNKSEGERLVALSKAMCAVIDDWVATKRPDVTDEYGREPLLTTRYGRAHTTHLRKLVYRWTQPCALTGECPHGRTVVECPATTYNRGSECPSSVAPHAIRRGAITHWLQRDWPTRVVSDRANVSADVLDKHYDRRTDREKMEQRRKYLDNL